MRMTPHVRAMILLAAAGLFVGLPGVEGLARSRRPAVVEAPPPPPPPAGPVGLPDKLIQDAAAYDGYIRAAGATSPGFTDADSVSSALRRSGAYAPQALIRGAIAYGAIAALRQPAFVAALRQAGNSPEHRRQMVGYILADPAYAYLFSGAYAAAGLAREAIGPPSLQLYATGIAIRKASYDIQKQPWSKVTVAGLKERLKGAEAQATGDMTPDPDRLAAARQSIVGASALAPGDAAPPAPTDTPPFAPPYAPLVAHAIQLAAIAALGEATDADLDRLSDLAVDPDAQACLSAAKRNFHQCLAVAKPNYEDIFCMGQHALRDTGVCLAKAAGYEVPAEPAPPPPAPAKKPTHRRRRA